MPIYEYECQACGNRTEVLQGLNEEPRRECEECGGELRRLISAPAVQFKGTGWYVTDYASKKGSDSGGQETSSSSSESKGSDASGKKAAASASKSSAATASE